MGSIKLTMPKESIILTFLFFLYASQVQAEDTLSPGLFKLNINNEIKIEKNKKLDDLPYLGKEFSVSFEFWIDSFPVAECDKEYNCFGTVLHLSTADGEAEPLATVGSRIPAVWIRPSKQFHETMAIGEEWNSVGNHAGETGRSVENTAPTKFENVKVFAGNPWYPAADGKIRNLRINTHDLEYAANNLHICIGIVKSDFNSF